MAESAQYPDQSAVDRVRIEKSKFELERFNIFNNILMVGISIVATRIALIPKPVYISFLLAGIATLYIHEFAIKLYYTQKNIKTCGRILKSLEQQHN